MKTVDRAPEKATSRKPEKGTTRRNVLKVIGAAAIAGGAPLAALGAPAPGLPDLAPNPQTLDPRRRPSVAFRKKLNAASSDLIIPARTQAANGDEALFPSGIANYTKGFPHNEFGEVDSAVYASYRRSVQSGKRADFDSLQMGGNTPLVDPQAGLAFDLEGIDVSQGSIPPFDTLTSPCLAAEVVEVYWQALVRDVPFSQYGTHPLAQAPWRSWASCRRTAAHG